MTSPREYMLELEQMIERVARDIVLANMPDTRIGTVFGPPATGPRTVAVRQRGQTEPAPGFVYGEVEPRDGDLVRVVIHPNGDRYVDAVLGRTDPPPALDVYDGLRYGAQPIHGLDNGPLLNEAIADAFNTPGGVVTLRPGTYEYWTPLATPFDVAGAITIKGIGRPRGLTGGNAGDPFAQQGVTLKYMGATGDMFLASVAGGNKRQYITIEGVSFEGNPAGTSGHGLHFLAPGTTYAILVTLRDVTVNGAKEHGIFFDGNVFESQLFNVRSSMNGGRGFKAAANGGGLPGETRFFGCTVNGNSVGVDLDGGGHWSFHGLTCTSNVNEGFLANSVKLEGIDLQLEANGTASGNQATITGCAGVQLIGVLVTVKSGDTGNGMSFVSCLWPHVMGYSSNSSVSGAGYMDIRFDNATTRGTIADYAANDFVDRIALGTLGGHQVHRGAEWLTSQAHGQQVITMAVGGNAVFDATKYDSLLLQSTGAGITITVVNPTINVGGGHQGQRAVIQIFNNTAGTLGVNWGGLWHLAGGAWVSPAAGKTRTIVFEWDPARVGFFEIARSAADIT